MTTFLILLPFASFAGLTLIASAPVSLFGAAVIALATIAYDYARGASIKILASGAVLLFVAVGGYVSLVDPGLSTSSVRLAVDAGVLVISLFSLALRSPFTLQYANEITDPETRKLSGFMRVNYIITWAWTAAFLLMVIGNLLMIYIPGLPLWAGLAVALAARNSAALFTKWYPKYRLAKISTDLAKQPLPASIIQAS